MTSPLTLSTERYPAPGENTPGELVYASVFGSFRARFDTALARLVAAKRAEAEAIDPPRLELIAGVERLLDLGGKRIRPAFVWFTYHALGGRRDEEVLPVALATELLHTYLLLHDDVMDHADLRRGEPSAQVRFRDAHRAMNLAGDASEFGISVAILLGDLAQSWAMEQLFALPIEGVRRTELLRAFAATCDEVISGQYAELLIAGRRQRPGEVGEEELLRVLQMKSGRYTAERPIQLGALLAAAPPELAAPLCRYGRSVGEAFQLQDDLLGTFGDPARTGKPIEADLKEGKLTVLVHRALAASAEPERQRIAAALGDPELTEERAREIQRLIEASGARGHVEAMIEERLADARDALADLPLEPEGAVFFTGLLDQLRGRDT